MYSAALTASAQVFNVLHDFTANDSQPNGLTAVGNVLYGTTQTTIFSINSDGSGFQTLYSLGAFSEPLSPLVVTGNGIYGTTYLGGTNSTGAGSGSVFAALNGAILTLHSFTGGADGQSPSGGLILSGSTLYGATAAGGSFSNGTLFSIQTDGSGFTVLHAFGSTSADGQVPNGALLISGGTIFGTTQQGGIAAGTIFSIGTNGAGYTVLYSFNTQDGLIPYAGLTLLGNLLYGTTSTAGPTGWGTLFSINQDGGGFSVLGNLPPFVTTAFTTPLSEPALVTTADSLYGATIGGGSQNAGTVFSLSPNGANFDVLYAFTGKTDGRWPSAGLVSISNVLYGTASRGGTNDWGTVYSLIVPSVEFNFEPTAQTGVSISSSAGFGAGATSFTTNHPEISYQWRRNGVNIPLATNSGFLVPSAQPADCGSLTVTISDGVTAKNSDPAPLTLNLPDAFGGGTFANRFPLPNTASGFARSSNTNGDAEPAEPQILSTAPGGKPVWFSWQPPFAGIATFSTAGSGFDTTMGVYIGNTLSGLSNAPAAINDDDSGGFLTSKTSFNAVPGTEYEIVVDGRYGVSGDIVLGWNLQGTTNSLPIISVAPPPYTAVSNGATVVFTCKAASSAISWFFNGQPTQVQGSLFGINSAGQSNVGVYVAAVSNSAGVVTTQPAVLEVSVNENAVIPANAIAFNKFLDAANAPFSTQPAGRPFQPKGGGDTRGYSVSQTFSTVGNAGEPDEPNICGQIGGAPAWYIYDTPAAGSLLVSTAGSSFNTMIGVFIGPKNGSPTLNTLTNLGCAYTTNYVSDGQPQVFIPGMPSNQVTFIGVDGYQAASGQVVLKIALGNPLTIASPLSNQIVNTGSNATFAASATGSTPMSYRWQFNGAAIGGATNSSLTLTNVQMTNAGTYSVMISNLLSVVSNSATLFVLPPPPLVTNVSNTGGSIAISGSGGLTNGTYYVLSSTNITAPLGAWTIVSTNAFDSSGGFNFSLPINSKQAQFFTIRE